MPHRQASIAALAGHATIGHSQLLSHRGNARLQHPPIRGADPGHQRPAAPARPRIGRRQLHHAHTRSLGDRINHHYRPARTIQLHGQIRSRQQTWRRLRDVAYHDLPIR